MNPYESPAAVEERQSFDPQQLWKIACSLSFITLPLAFASGVCLFVFHSWPAYFVVLAAITVLSIAANVIARLASMRRTT